MEPFGRNTLPSILWAAFEIAKHNPDGIMLVSPADHCIDDTEAFKKTLLKAVNYATTNDKLVTIGITPTEPHTGYGYIETTSNESEIQDVITFHEKPNLEKAAEYLSSGRFIGTLECLFGKLVTFLTLAKKLQPKMYKVFENLTLLNKQDKDYQDKFVSLFDELENVSIDYAIMEKSATDTVLIPSTFDWNDIGSWTSIDEYLTADDSHNFSKSKTIAINSKNNTIYAPKKISCDGKCK